MIAKNPDGAKPIEFMGWKDAYPLKAGPLEVVVVPAVGRMMCLQLAGGMNALSVKANLAGLIPSEQMPRYQALGGLYTWIAPQVHWVKPTHQTCDALDMAIDFGPYNVTRATTTELTMESPISETYGLKVVKNFKLTGQDAPGLEYTVTLQNVGKQPIRWSIWNLSAVKPNGTVFFASIHGEADLVSFNGTPLATSWNRSGKTFWITKGQWGIVDLRKFTAGEAKMGVRVGSPFLAYRQPGTWLIRSFPVEPDAWFTDRQSQIELWADSRHDYYELEVLSPEFLIKPGTHVTWRETMYLVADQTPMHADPEAEAQKLRDILTRLGLSVPAK